MKSQFNWGQIYRVPRGYHHLPLRILLNVIPLTQLRFFFQAFDHSGGGSDQT